MKEEMIIPNHVGIIMDGYGRWAKQRGMIRSLGHKAGVENLKKLLKHVNKLGVKYVSLYAFSTENFKRDSQEVNFLMETFVKKFTTDFHEIMETNCRVVFSGRKEPLPEDVLAAMASATEQSKNNTGPVLNICINYGGQWEIVDTTRKLCEMYKNGEIELEDITPESYNHYLYQDLPPLDYVIRTSGELRTSNFMPYQSSYAEYYFPKVLFPDFNEEEFDKSIEEYNKRNRRFGGVTK